MPFVWQTDTCVGGWFYDVRQVYKTPAHVIEMFVDIVAKNMMDEFSDTEADIHLNA